MRRTDREITDPRELASILDRHEVARVAFCDGEQPYLIPMNFARTERDGENILYFHCALEGRKLDLLQRNDRVAFEVDGGYRLLPGDEACDWSATFESVVGIGRMRIVTDPDERVLGMDRIMARHGMAGKPVYNPAVFARTAVLRLDVASMTGKRKTPPAPVNRPE
ncbi:MAG: pyridoxamine 5'-phosphate oxidase family protein [Clostridia bacterium]|nr:pyridoxamine 5'-phosphate oxidase family protein [Clostridia bacterium]